MPNQEGSQPALRALLASDHRELDDVFDALLNALHTEATKEALRLWAAFDDGLGRHMALEECRLLPALRREDPDEADALLEEHEQIRSSLAELGVCIERRGPGPIQIGRLTDRLRRHARREEALAYRWAARHLPESDDHALRSRLGKMASVRRRLASLEKAGAANHGVEASNHATEHLPPTFILELT